ncbi:hypothetical protein CBQ26_00560 [Deinococcus indicus]|uniref:Uncharacterized protein n=1 Tax=Deinococcus indicus TaxID=223556 RepID=A0A246BTH3_9DEIO|nr:hypothetical protein [Deinococcus indicus]OWL98984.1 hypothetical protein CBQ26_00560 [Deinococcus indicus]
MNETLAALRAQNTRTVHLLADGDTARSVPPGTPGALAFLLARVPARDIRANLLYAALGRDGYYAYANWFNAEAQKALAAAEAASHKPGDPAPFDDTLPDDGEWRAHTVALEIAVEEALLDLGMLSPTFEDAGTILGPYRTALARELVTWGREVPESPDSPSGNSVPP